MGLTVAEKEHWKTRIAKRIDAKIERIKAQDPTRFDAHERVARVAALESLGLDDAMAELEAARAAEAAAAKRVNFAMRTVVAALRKVPESDVSDSSYNYYGAHGMPPEVTKAIDQRAAAHLTDRLKADPIGQSVLALEAEKDQLIDTVWLATSPAQIKQLWTEVLKRLDEEPTPLGQVARDLPPTED
jgi:hypothetical protein